MKDGDKLLTKYPIKTDLAEYRVDIKKKYITLGMYQFKVQVYYQEDRKFTLFGLFPSKKWVEYFTYETGWSGYEQWIGKYVELAKHAVNEYENIMKKEWDQELSHENGLKEWESWDGNCV